MTNDKEEFINVMAQMYYSHHLLVKLLIERGLMKQGEPTNRWNNQEFQQFLDDFRKNYFPSVN
jgi:hypothetical protein